MSARSDALAAQLAVLRSKAERREAVRRFEEGQLSTEDVRAAQAFRSFLAAPGQESRAAGEATGNQVPVPTRFSAATIMQLREYDGLLGACEQWETPDGGPRNRPIAVPENAGVAQTENSAFTEGPYMTLANQAWGMTPYYAASVRLSNQVVQDAYQASMTPDGGVNHGYTPWSGDSKQQWQQGMPNPMPVGNVPASPTLDGLLAQLLAQSLGRVIAPVVQTALYAAITAGVVATPAVPASTVTATNSTAFPVQVVITGGTLTVVSVNGSTVGTTPGTYVVPPGGTIAITYTVAPTWAWSFAAGPSGGFIQLGAATPVSFITGTASTELIQNTINIDTAAQMFAALDVAYHDGAAFYFSLTQWSNLIRQVDAQKHLQIDPSLGLRLFDRPVVLTSQTSTALASTVSGPVYGNLGAALTLRIAGGVSLLRSTERYAEFAQTYYRGATRVDVQTRDSRAVVGVKFAAT